MGIAAVFAPPDGEDVYINSISFSSNGRNVVCSRDNGVIDLVNVECARLENRFKSEKGATHVASTHHDLSVLVGTKDDGKGTVAYVSMHDSTIMRRFEFHNDSITGISMSPLEDKFISTSADGAMALWDLRMERPVLTNAETIQVGSICSSFDPSGVVYGVALGNGRVSLYSTENLGQDAFLHNHVLDSMATDFMWTDMTFSDDDRFIALSGSRGIVLVDAFSLREVSLLHSHAPSSLHRSNAAFSEDGTVVCTGGKDGRVRGYYLRDAPEQLGAGVRWAPRMFTMGEALGDGGGAGAGAVPAPTSTSSPGTKHNLPVSAVTWHPEKAMFASGCSSLCLWTPPPPSG